MMKSEFENLAGRAVTNEQYRAIETLYMSSNLEKAEFVKSIRTMLKSIPQPERKKDIKRMVVRDKSGYRKTPNGCYYHIKYVENELLTCEPVHHIVELEDDWEQRLNPFNLIPLNHKTHNTITALYKQSKASMRATVHHQAVRGGNQFQNAAG